ncbi:hypothetical protein [Pasteurella multocida]|uniref:hypothetical protein n=1 Tax=Pasteurella multocida TaxID=747 RepID=UPI0023E3586A|nr:hypothetical protein [Pasteurella multocida]
MEKVEITKEFFDSLMKDKERLNFIECYRVTIIEDKPGENGGFELSIVTEEKIQFYVI